MKRPASDSERSDHDSTATASEPSHGGHVPALDGVRALAVTLVLLFHLGVPGFGGGYVGVDVFFVLSGFLITSLLLQETGRTGGISLPGFWLRRAKRLLPALVLVLLAVATWASLDPSMIERSSLRGDLLSTTAYVANWHFISTSTYFSNTGFPSPLQHTWSLAIEEQFYLVWPLVLACLAGVIRGAHVRKGATGMLALGVAVASAFALASLWTAGHPERAYMGTDSRIFEPLLGALGAVLVTTAWCRSALRRRPGLVGLVGIAGLAAGIAWVASDDRAYYFGGAGLVAVAALLIVAPLWVSGAGLPARALSLRPVAWIGMISYGIYLWHWPILLWLHPSQARGADAVVRSVLATVLTVGVAAASFYLVERPIRHGRRRAAEPADVGRWARVRLGMRRMRPGIVLAVVPLVLVSVAGISLAATNIPRPGPNQPVIMLVGDSVPLRLSPVFEREIAQRGWRLVTVAHGWCPVTGDILYRFEDGVPMTYPRCHHVLEQQDAMIRQYDPDLVVWWDRWDLNDFVAPDGTAVRRGSPEFLERRAETLDQGVRRLSSRGARVVLVGIEPVGIGIDRLCAAGHCYAWNEFVRNHYPDTFAPWNEVLLAYAAAHPGTSAYVSFADAICHDENVPCDDRIDGVPARKDGTHYDGAGEEVAAKALADRLAPLLDRTTS